MGAALLALALAPGAPAALAAAGAACGAGLLVAATLVARRALAGCTECRIGEAGVYFETLRGSRFVAWPEVERLDAARRTLRIAFVARDARRREEVWVDARHAAEIERVQAFARERIGVAPGPRPAA